MPSSLLPHLAHCLKSLWAPLGRPGRALLHSPREGGLETSDPLGRCCKCLQVCLCFFLIVLLGSCPGVALLGGHDGPVPGHLSRPRPGHPHPSAATRAPCCPQGLGTAAPRTHFCPPFPRLLCCIQGSAQMSPPQTGLALAFSARVWPYCSWGRLSARPRMPVAPQSRPLAPGGPCLLQHPVSSVLQGPGAQDSLPNERSRSSDTDFRFVYRRCGHFPAPVKGPCEGARLQRQRGLWGSRSGRAGVGLMAERASTLRRDTLGPV